MKPLVAQKKDLKTKLTENITLGEIVCKCGCNKYIINQDLLDGLQLVRDYANTIYHQQIKIHITSGFRCLEHNEAVAGAYQSYHTQGKAADWYLYYKTRKDGIVVLKRSIMFNMVCVLSIFNGIGVYRKGFMHTDVRDEDKYEVWFNTNRTIAYLSDCNDRGKI